MARFRFIADEMSIGEEKECLIEDPIRYFRLQDIGVDEVKFLCELAPTFSMLAWDPYDVRRRQVDFLIQRFAKERMFLDEFRGKYHAEETTLEAVGYLIASLPRDERWVFERLKPYRKRSFRRFTLTRSRGKWNIRKLNTSTFSQDSNAEKGDFRKTKRHFNLMSELVTEHDEFRVFLKSIAQMIRDIRPKVTGLLVKAHQTSIFADIESSGDNAPEGIHQDGADYVVSALVVERDGITGGKSVIYGDPDGERKYFEEILKPGEGLFHADKGSPLWHDVTQIFEDPKTPPTYGKRSIFGLDIDVIREE